MQFRMFVIRFPLATLIDYRQLGSPELIAECVATQQAAAWQEFVRRFQPLIAGVVARTAGRWTSATASLVDDLVQETYVKLCTEEFRRLREFESWHDDAIYGYLKAIAYRVTKRRVIAIPWPEVTEYRVRMRHRWCNKQ